jgi:CRP-like cAMP-binding protein
LFTNLIDHIKSLAPLEQGEVKDIEQYLTIKNINKGEFLVTGEDACNHLAFITSGYFRIFIATPEEDVTIHLEGPNNFISAFSSFISRNPTGENLQAVTPAEVVLIHYNDLHTLYKKCQKFEHLGRLMVERHFVLKQQRVISLIKENGETRYKNLMEKHPDFLLNIPLQYIASYLGMKPESLSRIRAKVTF